MDEKQVLRGLLSSLMTIFIAPGQNETCLNYDSINDVKYRVQYLETVGRLSTQSKGTLVNIPEAWGHKWGRRKRIRMCNIHQYDYLNSEHKECIKIRNGMEF